MFADQIDARHAGRGLVLKVPIRILRVMARMTRPRPVAYDQREIDAFRRALELKRAEAAFMHRRGVM
jgi:hypothetical protein